MQALFHDWNVCTWKVSCARWMMQRFDFCQNGVLRGGHVCQMHAKWSFLSWKMHLFVVFMVFGMVVILVYIVFIHKYDLDEFLWNACNYNEKHDLKFACQSQVRFHNSGWKWDFSICVFLKQLWHFRGLEVKHRKSSKSEVFVKPLVLQFKNSNSWYW